MRFRALRGRSAISQINRKYCDREKRWKLTQLCTWEIPIASAETELWYISTAEHFCLNANRLSIELAFVFTHIALSDWYASVSIFSHCVCTRITRASLESCVVFDCLLYNMLWGRREESWFWCVKCWCWFIGLATCKIYEYSSIRYNRLSPFPMWGSWELFRHLACAYPTSRSDWGAMMSRKALVSEGEKQN